MLGFLGTKPGLFHAAYFVSGPWLLLIGLPRHYCAADDADLPMGPYIHIVIRICRYTYIHTYSIDIETYTYTYTYIYI